MTIEPNDGLDRLLSAGLAISLTIIPAGLASASIAVISGAVVAQGTVVVESFRKLVQHQDGGIVASLPVEEGRKVQEGELLMRLDDTATRASFAVILKELDRLSAKRARLVAERDDLEEPVFPQTLVDRASDPDVAEAIQGEKSLFKARNASAKGKERQFRERIAQSERLIEGLGAQAEATRKTISIITRELSAIASLYEKQIVPLPRLLQLERSKSELEGQAGKLVADMAKARAQIAEIETQIIQVTDEDSAKTLSELQEADARLNELRERRTAAEDKLRRTEIRSPQAGIVNGLSVHTIGGVIRAGETVMYIVPAEDNLVIDASVLPQDVDQVAVGQSAMIRFTAFNRRITPETRGTVERVAADATTDKEQTKSSYVTRIRMNKSDYELKAANIRLVPGMPAEVFIMTDDRTLLSYLTKPIIDQFSRSLREK